jgi:hypothetical protein
VRLASELELVGLLVGEPERIFSRARLCLKLVAA